MRVLLLLALASEIGFASTITQKIEFRSSGVTAQTLYDLYIDQSERKRITRGHPDYVWNFEQNKFSIGHGNFQTTGNILKVIPGKRIVHTWNTSEYRDGEEGLVAITFSNLPENAGAKIELVHTVPDRLEAATAANWYYFHWLHWLRKFNLAIPIPCPLDAC